MTDKLTVYNKASIHLVERPLVSLTEGRESRRVFDSQWNDAVLYCLGQGLWRFAKRTVSIDASTTVTPAFGYLNAFLIPDDWIRTVTSSSAAQMDIPSLDVKEEAGYWYANCNPLYVAYISSDPLYGLNLGKWPGTFTDYVALRLALQSFGAIPGKDSELKDRLQKDERLAKRNAKGSDAMNDPPGQAPLSMLVRSRMGGVGFGRFFGGSGENG